MRIQLTGGTSLLLGTLLAASASAQSQLNTHKVTSPVKNAGTFHAATGTWTRSNAQSAIGPDVVYNNTGAISYFTTMPDNTLTQFEITDNGRIPSLSDVGDDDVYTVDGLFFAYCSSSGLGANLNLNYSFENSNAPCTRPAGGGAGVAISGLPTSATIGTQGCWLITIDLAGTTDVFTLDGDADGFYDASNALDDFGYTFAFTGHGSDTSTGPILFGDPGFASPYGDGTSNFGFGAGPDGTGLDQQDFFWIETPALLGPGCYFFGGYPANPWGGFYLRLMGDGGAGGPVAYCAPGGANSVSANGGVLASAGGYGTSAATFDITDVPNQPGILYTGANQIQIPFGCGDRCAGGSNVRGAVIVPSGNQALGVAFDMSTSANTNIQYWYRDPANFANCGSAFNLSNALGL